MTFSSLKTKAFRYRKPRPIWIPVLAKGLMRVSMATAVGCVFLDAKAAALIALGTGALADMFDNFFILYDKELSERERLQIESEKIKDNL